MNANLFAVAAGCFMAFAFLGAIVAHRPPTRIDVEATALRGVGTPLAILFTRLGRWYSVTGITALAIFIAVAMHRTTAVIVALFVAQVLGQGAVNALKVAYRRPRPDEWLHRLEVGLSYPSGHAATAIIFFFGLLLLVVRSPDVPHALVPAFAAALGTCVVGLPWSRVALGAHYATDVIGGLLFGAGWLATLGALVEVQVIERNASARPPDLVRVKAVAMGLRGKTLFITGASRGIGLAIALRAAKDGANIAVVAKTTEPHPKLPGTIFTAAQNIEAAGGHAFAVACDIRSEEEVRAAVARTVERFSGIDICINNASAISLTPTPATEMKRFDLMMAVNVRGTFLCSKETIPFLRRSENPHILNLSPPLDLNPKWFAPHAAYSIAKYGMSLCTLGMAEELRADGIAVNSLWPVSTIDTAAVRNLLGGERAARVSRSPRILADAAYAILTKPSRACTGHFFIDEEVLRGEGQTDFTTYASVPDERLARDFFVPDEFFRRVSSRVGAAHATAQ